MENLKKKLESGSEIEIQMASWEVSNRLLKAVMREIEAVKVNLGAKGGIKSLADLEVTDDLLNTIKDVATRLIASDAVEAVLWDCFKTVVYNGQRITKRDVFDPSEAREDYLPIAKEVLVYNLSPFFKSLGSMWSVITKDTAGQQQK